MQTTEHTQGGLGSLAQGTLQGGGVGDPWMGGDSKMILLDRYNFLDKLESEYALFLHLLPWFVDLWRKI